VSSAVGPARIARIEAALRAGLAPVELHVEDESHKHRGHAGAADGRGHFRVRIVSSAFEGRSRVQRHRLLYDTLGDQMQTDIHALAIDEALTPEERARRS
jgi:BolA family transcriptional regulator, general stress-responsive regulator